MSLLDHVAMAVDFSEPSRIALAAIYRLAGRAPVKHLSIIHSVQEVVLPHGDQPEVKKRLEDLRERIQTAATTQLEEMCSHLTMPDGVEVTHHIVEGAPARVIPQAAAKLGATVLALGTHHRKGIRLWLKGSIAEQIVRGTTLPVLVMPMGDDGVPPELELQNFKYIVVGLDVHTEAEHVARAAIEAAQSATDTPPTVVFVTSAHLQDFPLEANDAAARQAVDDVKEAIAAGAKEQLDMLAAKFASSGVRIETRVLDKAPVDAIIETCAELGASLIVVGTHGRNKAPFIEIGSTTAKSLRASNVSVLVVPSHPEHD